MRKKIPASVIVIAVFHLLIGAGGMICGLCALGMNAAGFQEFAKRGDPQKAAQTERRQQIIDQVLDQRVPSHKAYEAMNMTAHWLWSVVLVAAGIGLLMRHRWAHMLSVAYASASLLHKIFQAFYSWIYLNPAMEEAFRQLPPDDPGNQPIVLSSARAAGMAGPCVMMIYPLIVLIIMLLPSVLTAFYSRGEPPAAVDDKEYDEPAVRRRPR